MRLQRKTLNRRGAVLPLVAICLVALIGMVALAIDLGMVAIARNQCQNAADGAAMAGVRVLNGDAGVNYKSTDAPLAAMKIATANRILGTYVPDSNVSIELG